MNTEKLMSERSFWDKQIRKVDSRVNWWSSDHCTAYYNERICGQKVAGNSYGCLLALKGATSGRLSTAISIGCGTGDKERQLLNGEIVDRFELWEMSQARIQEGIRRSQEDGTRHRIDYRYGNAFNQRRVGEFDLVYWDHSLHHMSDVRSAIEWSVESIRPGGFLLVNDYFGPNRLQWRNEEALQCNRFLKEIENDYGWSGDYVRRGNVVSRLRMRLRDPSEAPQSELIEKSIAEVLGAGVNIVKVGGTALNILGGLVVPFFPEHHQAISRLVEFDRQLNSKGFWHFGFYLWQKGSM